MTFEAMDHVGRKIRRLRAIKGLTQQQLADLIHKERPLISHIERTGKVNHETYLSICRALEVTPEQVEQAEEPLLNWGSASVQELKLKQAEIDRLQAELKLKDEMIALLKNHIKSLTAEKK